MPENIDISDPYFMGYYMYSLALKDIDMHDGLTKALYFAKICFNADNVILYKQDETGDYVHKHNSALMNTKSTITTAILNSAKSIIEKQNKYIMSLNLENMHNIAFIKVDLDDKKYVIALTGNKEFKNIDDKSTNVFIDTMRGILGKFEQFDLLTKTSEIDLLTKLSNRNKYESDISITKISDGLIFAIFDLFRLKNINDNYDHQKGDEYIKKTAEVLKIHFPKYIYTIDSTGKKVRSETGTCLYRIGGDEFALISSTESYENALIKIMIIQDEIKNMDLGVSEPLGINFGLVRAKNGDTFRDLYLRSDALLSKNKKEYYKKMGYERRK